VKIIATIEARMTSTRLPGKVLMLADGKPMLAHLVNRLKFTPSIDDIVIEALVLRRVVVDKSTECGG
jgi:spore coat polysaccharide biosynthesis protein SpsF